LLRDCAKVIKKNDYNKDQIDPDLEKYLTIDISNNDNGYDESLEYEWCGGNSYVVICGDMIDPKRNNNMNCKKNCAGKICNCTYYPQLEIKLLRFINKMNKLATKFNGRIIKLLGNHEASNIFIQTDEYGEEINELGNYIFDKDIDMENNYYRNYKRYTIFKKGNIGYDLLFEDDCGILIKINNTIFVHGKIPSNYNLIGINKVNNLINYKNEEVPKIRKAIESIYKYLSKSQDEDDPYDVLSPLWNRTWGYVEYYRQKSIKRYLSLDSFCIDDVKNELITFLGVSENEIEDYRVVIGHCVQSSNGAQPSTTFANSKKNPDQITKTYDASKIYSGESIPTDPDKIFGITMGCDKSPKNGLTDFYIYRVDVGSSREFDDSYDFIINKRLELDSQIAIERENKYLFSKTPQILAINRKGNQDIITIIKSKMRNTRIHLPRPQYEQSIISNTQKPNTNLKNLLLSDPHYDLKYLKYKKKYLELKKNNMTLFINI
jgi:hypothetical protein